MALSDLAASKDPHGGARSKLESNTTHATQLMDQYPFEVFKVHNDFLYYFSKCSWKSRQNAGNNIRVEEVQSFDCR